MFCAINANASTPRNPNFIIKRMKLKPGSNTLNKHLTNQGLQVILK